MINKGVISTGKFLPKVNCGLFRWLIVPIFACIIAMLLNPSPVSAYTMSINTSLDASVDITPSDDSNNSARITNDEVIIVTNCKAGYNLTLSSSVNDNNLYLDGDSSNNTSGTYFAPSNGTTALNNATNTWGYFFSSYSRGQTPTVPTTTSVFSPVPTLNSTPAILKTTAQTASSTDIDDTLNVYLGVNMDNGMTPGSYKMIPESNQNNAPNGSLVYYLTMDGGCRNYTVSFNPNGGTGTMDPQDITVGEATNLVPNSYTAPALGESYQNAAGTTIPATAGKMWTFWGWNTAIDGSGDWYKDRESVTDLAASGSIITLYAQWKQATLADLIPDPNPSPSNPKTIDHDTMQDMSAAACWNSEKFVAIGTPYGQTTLKDTRDGNNRTYTVAKLPDGLCWMTQNLNLGTSTPITLTANDTDLEEGTTFTLPASNPTDFSTSSTRANYNKPTVYNDVTVPNYTVNSTVYSGKINAYYSYAAATADTSTYGKGSTVAQINTSICPKNWDLPTNVQYYVLRTKGSIASYNNTNASYIGKNAGNEPYYFIYGGYRKAAGAEVNTTNFNNLSTYGYLWTANNYSATQSRGTHAYSGGLNNSATATPYYKYYGLGVRCVAGMDAAAYTITYTNTDTSATQTQEMVMGESAPIQPATTWTRTGYRLMGWDTNSSGTNVVYTTGQSITPSSDMTLYTVWKPSYTLQYNGNGSDAGVMTNVKHTNVIEGDTFDLFASNFSKTGYGFAGWSFDQNAQPGGASRIYGPNEAITAPAPTTPGETKYLYAVWVPAETGVYMQTWNGCSSMNVGDVIALKDQRDDNVYTVGKLADENCWMMENLRLDTAGSSDSTKSQGFGGVFNGLANSETSFSNSTTANSLYSIDGSTTYTISGSNQSSRFPRYNNANTDNRSTSPSVNDNRAATTSPHAYNFTSATYSYGNYYTWAAALANTNDYTSRTATIDGKTSETAGTSICPAGWKLPYGYTYGNGATSGGFYYLGTQLGATTSDMASSRVWRSFPINYVYSGSLTQRGSGGNYLSSTSNTGTSSFIFTFGSASVNLGNTNSKYKDGSVRCVKDDFLYDAVQRQSKGTLAENNVNLSDTITQANSGVYTYDATTYGTSSDAANTSAIYFYRGILDTNAGLGTYGSDGAADAYPNYVKTGDGTCWRIIRTTGSGGVKMIYNGVWLNNTCANPERSAETITTSYADTSDAVSKSIVGVGYTYNSTYASTSATSSVAASTVLGSNSNYAVNNTNSNVKNYIEGTYANTLSTTILNMLEPSAGYCNDRKIYNASNVALAESTGIVPYGGPYTTEYRFGPYIRNWTTTQSPTLNCARSTVDLYTTADANGGNKQLAAPIALITVDELAFAGSGNDAGSSEAHNANSFLYTGHGYWTMSPSKRDGWSSVAAWYLEGGSDNADAYLVSEPYGIRPVISVKPGTKIISGTGVATDPWLISPIETFYSISYNGNNADSGIDMSVSHTRVRGGDEVMLYAPNYKRASYGFAGWSTEQLNPSSATFANDLADAIDDGLVFGPNETITLSEAVVENADSNNNITLYAVWLPSAGNIQNWNGCPSLNVGSVVGLKDTRDNSVYAVAKLDDGNCWMMENLRLNVTGSNDSTKTQGFGGVFSGLANPETDDFTNSTTANSKYSTSTITGGSNKGVRIPRFNNANTASAVSSMTSSDQNIYGYGNYYSWAAAIANTDEYNTNNQSVTGTSLCPAGWELPSGGTDEVDDSNIYKAMSTAVVGYAPNDNWSSGRTRYFNVNGTEGTDASKALRRFPANFVYSGEYQSSAALNKGAIGRYWTRTTNSATGGWRFSLDATSSYPGNNSQSKGYGLAVRCMMGISYTITYDGNNADSGIGMSVEHSDVKKGDEVSLYAANYKKAGYGFAGWSTEQLNPNSATFASDLANAVNSGLVFGPNETITLNNAIIAKADENGEIPMYAIWIASAGNIQNWNGCGVLADGAVTALTDTRDNQVYAVAKLADGNCWMIENLRLNTAGSDDETKAQGFGGVFVGLANAETTTFGDVTTANSLYNTTNISGNAKSTRFPRYYNANTNSSVANMTSASQNIYSYGNLYTWSATIADTSYYANADQSVATSSICPIGWHIPKGGTKANEINNEYWKLIVDGLNEGTKPADYSSSNQPMYRNDSEAKAVERKVKAFPNNFVQSGAIYTSSYNQRGTYGLYWSSTNNAEDTARSFIFKSTTEMMVDPGTNTNYKYNALTVRCKIDSTYNIVYNGNNADSGISMSARHNDIKNGDDVALNAPNYKKTGYGFAGWSTEQLNPNSATFADDLADAVDDGLVFGPNETITLNNTMIEKAVGSTITLYAVWVPSAGNIQNWNGCSTLETGSVTALKDARDDNVYAVAKLADGNCWMIENLRLESTAAHNSDGSLAQGYATTTSFGSFVGLANNETTGFNNTNPPTANSLYSPSASGSKMVIGTSNYPYNRIPRYNNTRTITTWGGQGVYGYGNYYNWPAAVASTGYYATVNASVENTSICPTGWRLPRGGNRNNEANNDYWNLVVDSLNNGSRPENYNSDINPYYTGTEATPVFRLVKKYPNNFVHAGYYNNNAIADDSYGYYWTSTVSDSGSARFGFGSGKVYPGTRNSSRYSGFSVRCMIKNNN